MAARGRSVELRMRDARPRWGVGAVERAAWGGGGGCSTDARCRAAPISGSRGVTECVRGGGGGGRERGWGQGELVVRGGGAAAAVLAGGDVV